MQSLATLRLPLALILLATPAAAQVDFVFANNSLTTGSHPKSLTMLDASGGLRPLAQANADLGGTSTVVARPVLVDVAGTPYLYWYDNETDHIHRGTDLNGNGVIDPVEIESVWDITATGASPLLSMSADTLTYEDGKFLLSDDGGGATAGTRGALLLEDLNGDGDLRDPLETVEVVNQGAGGPFATIPVVGSTLAFSTDDVEAAELLGDDLIFWDDDDKVWLRKGLGASDARVFLNYAQDTAAAASVPVNPDFGATLPTPPAGEDLDIVSVDRGTGTVYLGVEAEASAPWIYACLDGNADGDVNDAGEVTLFFDGGATTLPGAVLDDFVFHGGSLFVTFQDAPGFFKTRYFVELADGNGDGDAMDAGEMTIHGTLADNSTVHSMTVVPAGTFGAQSCVRFMLSDNGVNPAGGTLVFELENIPSTHKFAPNVGIVALSQTQGAGFDLGGCNVGLTLDALTLAQLDGFLNEFSTSGIFSDNAFTNGLAYGPELATLLPIYYAAVILGPNGTIASHTRELGLQ